MSDLPHCDSDLYAMANFRILAVFDDKWAMDHFLHVMRDLFPWEVADNRRQLRSGNIEIYAVVVKTMSDAHRFAGVNFIDWWNQSRRLNPEVRDYLDALVKWVPDHTHHSLDDGL